MRGDPGERRWALCSLTVACDKNALPESMEGNGTRKKETRLHHLKCDFTFFQVDPTAPLSLVQGVFVPCDC